MFAVDAVNKGDEALAFGDMAFADIADIIAGITTG